MKNRELIFAGILTCGMGLTVNAQASNPGTEAQVNEAQANEAQAKEVIAEPETSPPAKAADATEDVKEMTDAEIVMAAQAAGYKIVNERGTKLYCKTDDILGSRLRKKTRCLTAAEIEQEKQAADRTLSDLSRASYRPRAEDGG
jgi:hypothetical protein